MAVVIDPQASGWRDDGTESGVERVELVRGREMCVPIPREPFTTLTTTGTASLLFAGDTVGDWRNGSGQILYASCTANAAFGNACSARFTFNGRIFGLRYLNTLGVPFGLTIDGVPYTVPAPMVDPMTGLTTTYFDGVITRNLSEGQHIAVLDFTCDATAVRQWNIYGMIVDSVCNREPLLMSRMGSSQFVLGTSYSSLYTAAVNKNGRAYRGLWLANSSASAVAVSIKDANYGVFFVGPVPANDTRFVDFGMPLLSTELQALAGTGSVVTATPQVVI